ncbi:MAG: SBBP repeat-containing protein [Ignavibacteriaceae bacterium]
MDALSYVFAVGHGSAPMKDVTIVASFFLIIERLGMNSGKISVTIFLIMILFMNITYSQVFDWAKNMSGSVSGRDISTDNFGNSSVTGLFSGTATFGTTQITSNGDGDIFIAKYDANGNFQWVQQAGGTSINIGQGINIDNFGNSYVTGLFSGTATFGTTQIMSNGDFDIFIAKYDANGNFQWVQKAGGTSTDVGLGISTDNIGNCYVTGYFFGTATFGITDITSVGIIDIFIAKYDANGNFQWVQKAGGTSINHGKGIFADNEGNCYVTGIFNGTATFGTTQISSLGGQDIFIAKYDANGNFQWVQKAGGSIVWGEDEGQAISTDTDGNIYVTGRFYDTATFGTTQITSNGDGDIFIAKYDANGNFQWIQKAGGASNDYGYGISTDNIGNIYVTGRFYDTATFGTTQIMSYGNDDIFIAKYDANGNFQWVQKAGGASNDYGYGISTDNIGNIYVTGDIGSISNFGNTILNSWGGFIVKLGTPTLNITSPFGSEVWQTNYVHNITWNSFDDGNIKIEITTNNGTNWFTLQSSVQASLGNFTFTIPPFPNSNECRIRLTSLSYGNVSTSGFFSITSTNVPNLTIASPNTSVKWNVGSTQNISWIKTGDIDNVKLEYTTDNGNIWSTIMNSTPASDQSFSWAVPDVPSIKCRVRVSNIANSALNDVSDELFTIANIAISAPIGGEKCRAQTNKDIEWNSIGVTNVKLFYSTNNGTDWLTISNSVTASNGTYSWTVPSVASTNCRIKIEDASDNTLIAISDVFGIWEPIVSAQTPATGQITQGFGTTNITFSAFVLVSSTATVTFYLYESPQQGTQPNGVLVVSGYYWTITSPAISFFNGVISVPLAALMGVTDPSKLVWLKRANAGDAWTNIGGNVSEGNLLSTVAFESFSEFAIGSTDASNPLPVELVLFKGNVLGKEVVLDWATKTEVNNYGFIVERRDLNNEQNATEWKKRGFVKGAGNSNSPKEYSFSDDHLNSGKYQYRLKMIDNDGTFENSSIVEAEIGVPHEYTLSQNYPNPFNPSTKIEYTLPSTGHVLIQVFAVTGQLIKTLVDVPQDAGYYSVDFSPLNISSGMYFYKLSINDISIVKKMVFLK